MTRIPFPERRPSARAGLEHVSRLGAVTIFANDPQHAGFLRPAHEDMVRPLNQVGTAMEDGAGATEPEDEETVAAEFREVGGEDRLKTPPRSDESPAPRAQGAGMG